MYFIEMFLEQWIMIAFQLKLLEWIIHKKMKFYKYLPHPSLEVFQDVLYFSFMTKIMD